MDPQIKSILTSVLMGAATSAAAWATAHGVIPGGDQSALANDLVAAALWAITAGIAWIKARQHTPAAMATAVSSTPAGQAAVVEVLPQKALINAVNRADNGVKVVSSAAEAQQVNVPLK